MAKHYSTKTYGHNIGLSAVFRQPHADSHCRFLHGYSLQLIVGYQNVNQCHTEYTNTTSSVVNEYDITYNVNGTYVTMRVNKAVGNNTWVGKTQRFRINYQLIN